MTRARLRDWAHWLYTWLFRAYDPVTHHELEKIQVRMEEMHREMALHLQAIEHRLSVPITALPIGGLRPIRHDCGHENISWATLPDGYTECRDCHQRRYEQA